VLYEPIPEISAHDAVAAPPLREQLRRRFVEQPDLPALYADGPEGGRWLTYGELGRAVNQTADALAALGAAPGGRVGVMLPNGEAFVRVWLALAMLNVTMVPVNVGLVGAGLRYVLESTAPDLLVVEARLAGTVRACGGGEAVGRVVVWGGAGADGTDLPPRPPSLKGRGRTNTPIPPASPVAAPPKREARSTDAARVLPLPFREGGRGGRSVVVQPDDLALIIYTSGTTGPSKGVMLSRAAQLWHGLNYLRDFIRLGPGEVGYTPLPLFHVSAQGFTLGCLLGGAAVVVGARFQPFSFWETVRRHNVKAFNYVGAMIPMLYHRRPRPDAAANPVERAVGSATAPELHEAFERRFGLRLIETYGQSEMAGLWLMQAETGRRIGTVGGPRRWLEAAVLRPDGSVAAPGETGEIALRPEHPLLMTSGYFQDTDATARAFRGGWYWTGDAGSQDADGNFRFRGRLKDFIRRRGENISAFEIEREALTHPAVREAAAVGVASEVGEDEVKLCVVLHEGATLGPVELDRHLRPRLAAFMRPRYIEIRADFPRTPTQRVQKFKLREEGIAETVWDRKRGSARRRTIHDSIS
jgi:crotonobetaine/carnitine-CoA ligase